MAKTMTVSFTETAEVPVPPTDLPFDDGENMDSPWHRANIELLIDSVETRWRGRKDFYVGGNMFVHFDEERARNRNFRGPDFFVALDADHDKPRLNWTIWEENGRYPDFILELLSPTTAEEDRTTKKRVYEQFFHLPEYFFYDPELGRVEGFRLSGLRFVTIPLEPDGRVWSDVLGGFLGTWRGTYLGHEDTWVRLFEADGSLVLTAAEAEAARAETEAKRAEAEAARADAAVAEAERLRCELEALRQQLNQPNP
jgi:Uma2 family endonuclease